MPFILSFTFPPHHPSWPAPSPLIRLSSDNTFPELPLAPVGRGGGLYSLSSFSVQIFYDSVSTTTRKPPEGRDYLFSSLNARGHGHNIRGRESNSAVLVNETPAWPRACSTTCQYSPFQPPPAESSILAGHPAGFLPCTESSCLSTYHVLSNLASTVLSSPRKTSQTELYTSPL